MKNFVKKIVAQDTVFTLVSNEEYAFVGSNLFSNTDGTPVPVCCFWSSEDTAKCNQKEDWISYKIETTTIASFIEDMLIPLINESYILGLDFDENLIGIEADPLDTLLLIIEELKTTNTNVELEYFKNLSDLEKQAKNLL